MQIIDELLVQRVKGDRGVARIQLLEGDLSAIPARHAVDALVVSAFPNSYTPNAGTLFESLYRRGLDMRQVARHKEEDERNRLGCWLSTPLPATIARKFHFKRIICFEPRYPTFIKRSGINEEKIEEAVGFVFRCLNNFVIPDANNNRQFDISRVAMPLLATGNQRVPVEELFPRLLEAAAFWLEQGLPVDQLKIVAFRHADVNVATKIFRQTKSRSRRGQDTPRPKAANVPASPGWECELAETLRREIVDTCTRNIREGLMKVAVRNERAVLQRLFNRMDVRAVSSAPLRSAGHQVLSNEYDIFISYAHKQDREVKQFVRALRQRMPSEKIFFDRASIPTGGQWIKILSDAIQHARMFIAILSPDYTVSPVCWDEFQCAKLKEYNSRQSVIKTLRLYSEKQMPPLMGIYSYIDCAEGDLTKLRAAAATV